MRRFVALLMTTAACVPAIGDEGIAPDRDALDAQVDTPEIDPTKDASAPGSETFSEAVSPGGHDAEAGRDASADRPTAPRSQPDCARVTPPMGYTWAVAPRSFPEVPQLSRPQLFIRDFPNTGGSFGVLLVRRRQYASLRFVAPRDVSAFGSNFTWEPAQRGGEADPRATYITISQCPGDFRIPAPNTPAPPDDPTLVQGCRNLVLPYTTPTGGGVYHARIFRNTIFYSGLRAGDDSFCPIEPGGTYYFNVILADPFDGIDPDEFNCGNPELLSCGIEFSSD